jgi:sec-independent protein translocase protein TatC
MRPDMEPKRPEALNVIGHLDELRGGLIRSAVYLAAGTLAGLFAAKPVIELLKHPARGVLSDFILMKPTDIISVYLRAAVYAGAVVASPLILREMWLFVKPAVPEGPRVAWWAWIAAALLLFAGGTLFAYWVLAPAALNFLLKLSREVATPLISLNFYLSFLIAVLALGGAVFEIPVAVALLTRLGLITPRLLLQRWREAIFILLAAAAVLSPTTDVFNMLLFALPMIFLYAASIGVSALMLRDRKKKSAEDVYRHET